MTVFLLLIAVALTLLARYMSGDTETGRPKIEIPRLIAMIAVALIGAAIIAKYGPEKDRLGLEVGLLIGVIGALLGEIYGGKFAPMGIGVSIASALHMLAVPSIGPAQIALLCGCAIGAITIGSKGAFISSIVASVCVSGDFLGSHYSNIPASAMVGSTLGLAGLVGVIISQALPKASDVLRPVAISLALIIGGYLSTRSLGDMNLTYVIMIGAAAGFVVNFLISDSENDVTRIAIAAVIAVSIATIAFGFAKGTGMALALGAMVSILLGCGNRTALLAIAPLFGLVLYRLLKEINNDSTKALDIGQHYALLGVMLGALIPLLPANWVQRTGSKGGIGAFIWSILILSGPVFIAVMLGEKGSIGFVAGLGLSGLCQALRTDKGLMSLAIIPGLAATTTVCLDWFHDWTDLARDDKVKVFMIAGVAVVILSSILAIVAKAPTNEVTV